MEKKVNSIIYHKEKVALGRFQRHKVSILINLAARIIKRIKKRYLYVILGNDFLEIRSHKNHHYILFYPPLRHFFVNWLNGCDFEQSFLKFEDIERCVKIKTNLKD